MRQTESTKWDRSFFGTAVVWSVTVVLLLVGVGTPLLGCDGGTAVPDPGENPGLVSDCKVLLGLKDELAGTATLNWSTDLVITDWVGVQIGGSPSRVTSLILDDHHLPEDNQLTGRLPAELGQLSALRNLGFGYQRLTGEIPVELGELTQLRNLAVDGNQLTGEIPWSWAS